MPARLSIRAELDVATLAFDISDIHAASGAALFDRINRAVALLSDFPKLGRVRNDLGAGHRVLVVDGRWSLEYVIEPEGCVVVRVRSGAVR